MSGSEYTLGKGGLNESMRGRQTATEIMPVSHESGMTASMRTHRNHDDSGVGRSEKASGRKLARAPVLGGVAGDDASVK